jgi:hypothetical protein
VHYSYAHKQFGRLYTRFLISEILTDACCVPAYDEHGGGLVAWNNPELWRELRKQLQITRRACLRKDCAVINMNADTQPNDRTGNHGAHKSFHEDYKKCVSMCKIHEKLASIRPSLEKQIREGKNDKPMIDDETVEAIL